MNGIKKYKVLALDSNLFIYHFEDNPAFNSYTNKVFDRLSNNTLKATTSIISVIEALSFPSPSDVIKNIEKAFATIPNLTILDIDQKIAFESARIRRHYKFLLPDAVQLATALTSNSQAFITNDQKLKSFKEIDVLILNKV